MKTIQPMTEILYKNIKIAIFFSEIKNIKQDLKKTVLFRRISWKKLSH